MNASFRQLLPAIGVAALLAVLALLLDHGVGAGLRAPALDAIGRVYFALLLGAPLVVYPFAWRAHVRPAVRVGLSLLPGFLWWLTEIRLRLEGHSWPEALWLATSPINLAHLYVSFAAIALADLGCRVASALGGGERSRRRPGTVALVAAALLLGPLIVLGSIPVYLSGYRILFQRDRLPTPSSLPGPLPPGGAVFAPGAGAGTGAGRRPDIVFILSDDHRFDFAGYAGHPFVETPSLDRLASQGVRFSRAYVTTSLCSPSRASFLTGTLPQRHGVWNNFTPWSDANRTFLEYLGQAGYATAFIGKWHMPGELPQLRGVDHFVTFTTLGGQGRYEWCPLVVDGRPEPSSTRYIATELTDRALAWMEANRDRPFALVLSHKNVHFDFTPDEPERDRYARVPLALPAGTHPWTHLLNAQYTHLDFQPLGASVRRYAEATTSLDREIGRVLDFLDRNGLADDTLVVYASDNGYLWGEHGLMDKRWPYEESIRIPLLIRYPAAGAAAGSSREALVANVDVAPTLLEAAGLVVPEGMQGRSLLPLLGDADAPQRDALLYDYIFEPPYPTPTTRAVVTDRYKYVEYEGLPPELYDLEVDPHEQQNRMDEESPERIRALAMRLEALEEEARH